MLVTCKFSGGVWSVDGTGAVANVGNFRSAGPIGEIENPAVVPRGFGPFGGQLWVSDEDYPNTSTTVPGALHAMDSGGNATLDVVEWQDAEGVLVIPQNLCTFCQNNGTLFQAITLNELGPYGIYEYFPVDFTGLGGNVLVPSEGANGTALVQFNGTNYVTSFFDSIPGGTFEGASFADCDVPTPTPTFTPTATFTPTPTATCHSYIHTDSYSDVYADRYIHAYIHSNIYTHSYIHAYSNSYGYGNSDTNTYSDSIAQSMPTDAGLLEESFQCLASG